MIYAILHSYTYLFLMILFLLRTLLPNSKVLPLFYALFNFLYFSTQVNISLEKSLWSLDSSHILLYFNKNVFFISVLYNFSIVSSCYNMNPMKYMFLLLFCYFWYSEYYLAHNRCLIKVLNKWIKKKKTSELLSLKMTLTSSFWTLSVRRIIKHILIV